ncbi:MAG: DUF4249 family protein [candidate division Zixibacteria bacterium]|nr:DUF4249 family protein [candidate division Zixibacteria bacterium]
MHTLFDTRFGASLVRLLLGGLVFLSLMGCEDVIQVDLNSAEPRPVIEGFITLELEERPPHYGVFVVSRTTDFFVPDSPTLVTDADITISDRYGFTSFSGSNTGSGVYRFDYNSPVDHGDTVYATVTVDGEDHAAFSVVAEPTRIDSLTYEYQEGGGIGLDEEEGYRLHVHFTDQPEYDDYLRLKVYRNGRSIGDYHLYEGKYSDGNEIDYDYFFDTFQPGDAGHVELWSMSEALYDYFLTLSEVVVTEDGSDFFDITPANPNTNWSNDALGYFGVFYVDVQHFRIPED